MEAKMPEKWTARGNEVVFYPDGHYCPTENEHQASVIAEKANHAIDQAYAAGLEAGKAQAKAEPAQPAKLTVTEAAVWGQAYATILAAMLARDNMPTADDVIYAGHQADAAIVALRARTAPAQERAWVSRIHPAMQADEASTRRYEVAKLRTRIAELEAEQDKATAAERERCAGEARKVKDDATKEMTTAHAGEQHDRAWGREEAACMILDRILNPTK